MTTRLRGGASSLAALDLTDDELAQLEAIADAVGQTPAAVVARCVRRVLAGCPDADRPGPSTPPTPSPVPTTAPGGAT